MTFGYKRVFDYLKLRLCTIQNWRSRRRDCSVEKKEHSTRADRRYSEIYNNYYQFYDKKYEIATYAVVIILIALVYYMLVKTIRTLKKERYQDQKVF